ncbi:hypothetical protein [Trueperella sp. LYQ143]|uniref:hypothetical protein n=1 Tax=Trueperella sp. LYQ143 TaxID=3391059 RepID=UPI0039830BB7
MSTKHTITIITILAALAGTLTACHNTDNTQPATQTTTTTSTATSTPTATPTPTATETSKPRTDPEVMPSGPDQRVRSINQQG